MAIGPNLEAAADLVFERGMPSSPAAEKFILGCILLDNVAYYEAAEQIEPADFALDSHQRIFQRIGDLMESERAVDIVTLAEELARRKEVNAIGGVAYLASLTEGLPRRLSITQYIRIVKEKSTARRLINISSTAITRAADQSDPPAEILTAAIEDMEDSLARDTRRSGRSINDITAEDGPRFEAEANVSTGGVLGASLFTEALSQTTKGLQRGELCLLCARPHQGKTEAAIQTIVENARRDLRVHFFSLEMTGAQIVRRMARYIAMVPIMHMRDPRCLTPNERFRIQEARKELSKLPIVIDDTHELTTQEFRARSVLAAKRWKADLIVVDYAQLLLVPKAKNTLEEAKKQAESLRHIARDYCRTLALAQLRRAPPIDLNRFPDIEDIYGSSSFEQAAQMILMLHRGRKNRRYTGEDFCIIGKMRELQEIQPLKIKAERWGAFRDQQDTTSAEED